MPITVRHDVPKALDVLLALQSGGAVGAAERGKEDRAAARKAAEMREEMIFKAAQEEFHARQQAYRQQLNSQQEMQQQMMRGQQQMQAQQSQREWESQATQRATEQLQQQRKANRETFLSGQMGLGEYQQADAAFAARMAGLDPNAEAKQRQGLLGEFQKRADQGDKSALQGIHSKIGQVVQLAGSGRYSDQDIQGALAGLNEKERKLLESVQHKPDKSGPDPIQEAKEKLVPGEAVGMSKGTKYQWGTRAGQRELKVVEDPVLKAKMEAEAKMALEGVKQEGAAAKTEATIQAGQTKLQSQVEIAWTKNRNAIYTALVNAALARWKTETDAEVKRVKDTGEQPDFTKVPPVDTAAIEQEADRMAGDRPVPQQQQQPAAQPQGVPAGGPAQQPAADSRARLGELMSKLKAQKGHLSPEETVEILALQEKVSAENAQIQQQGGEPLLDWSGEQRGTLPPEQVQQDMGAQENAMLADQAVPIRTKEEFDALPPGTPYIAPDGTIRIKPMR